MKKYTLYLIALVLSVFSVSTTFGQGAPACPSVTVAPPATICSGNCTTLNATLVTSNQTTSYSVASIPYVPYSYTTGTSVLVSTDDVWSGIENIGFNFCYFGNTFNKFLIGANGQICFNTSNAGAYDNWQCTTPLPSTNDMPGNTISCPFRDIDPGISASGEKISFQMYGTAPCRALVVSWNNVPLYENSGTTSSPYCGGDPNSTFQCVLYENTNFIDVYVDNSFSCPGWNGGLGTIGIQNAAATVAVCPPGRNNTTFSVNGTPEAWRFTPTGAPSYNLNWYQVGNVTSIGTTNPITVCPTTTTSYAAVMKSIDCDGSSFNKSDTVTVVVTPGPTVTVNASPSVLCSGSSSVLTASGATTYSWSTGATTNPITVSPGSTTTYTVTGTNGGCSGTATVQVVVGPVSISANASPATLCPGNSSILTATGPAGTTYSWSTGATTNPITVSPGSTTTYTVTGTNGGCTGTATVTVTISPTLSLTANASPTTVCLGNSSTLTATGPGGTTYSWSTGATTNPTTVTPGATTTYTVTGTNGACTGTATVTVTISPTLSITANASPTPICLGSSSTLTATGPGGTTYSWSTGATTNPITVNPVSTTTYTVTGTNGGCTGTATVALTVNPVPTITVNSPTICAGSGGAILTASGGTNYSWSTGATTNPLTVTPVTTTSYTVIGTDANGCTNSAIATVTVNPQPTITVNSPTICNGTTATLTGTGGTTYSWNTGATTNSITVNPATTTSYTLTGTDANGCTNSAVATVTVNPLPTITANSQTICAGSAATLTASGGTTYSWSNGSTNNPLSVSPASTTTYTVVGTTGGCTGSAIATVTVNPTPAIDSLSALFPPICAGTLGSITGVVGTGGTAPYTYSWNPTGQTTANATGLPAGSYTLTVTDASGCTATSGPYTITASVVTASFVANPNSGSAPLAVNFNNTSTGANGYEWNLGNGNNSTAVNPSTTYPNSGTYNVELIATNSNGCTDTAYGTIDVIGESMLIIPNVFSPNGDGKNDVFAVKSANIASFDAQIFDRWGIKLYEWQSANGGWDGRTTSGSEVPSGTYYYLINATGTDGKQYQEKGYLTLLR